MPASFYVVLEDGETYGGARNAQVVSIDDGDEGLQAAFDSERAAEYLTTHGFVVDLGPILRVASAIAGTSPEYEDGMGFLACPYCEGDPNDGLSDEDWSHADDCPWLALARVYGEMPSTDR